MEIYYSVLIVVSTIMDYAPINRDFYYILIYYITLRIYKLNTK